MKAATYRRYGPPSVVTVAQVPKPVAKQNEVLIRVRATTVTTGDWRARSLQMPPGFGFMGRLVFGILGPRQPILGTELAGVIEAVGAAVSQFKIGDEVFAFPGARFGSHAEYRTMPEDGLIALKPANLSFEEAAALSFGGTMVLGPLRDRIGIKPGHKVLVVGASGGVGTAAVQIAKHLGAEVTGVCSTANADLVRSIGAARVIDYTSEDFAQLGESWDVIVDTTGSAPFLRCEPVLRSGGHLLVILGSFGDITGLRRPSKASTKTVIAGGGRIDAQNLRDLANLAKIGAYRPVIDRIYPLELAAEAHAYVDTGRKRGSVVLSV
ncbi:MAG: NAD(P)-dependent alcohol dehydrogenase [Kaiparowitsia implicata GSE-PSE-MK54-09C]|jgi:NADPH:quinone reductase-like Zn-dependent oxidoreductase|nr:NAD(P)-dependent alcohol dehydrogenase [Kaiparowitsia implicata GSE-PSE-MK54-09C]